MFVFTSSGKRRRLGRPRRRPWGWLAGFVSKLFFSMGLIFLAGVVTVVTLYLTQSSSNSNPFPFVVAALCCLVFLFLFFFLMLMSLIGHWMSYRIGNGSRAVPDLRGDRSDAGDATSLRELLQEIAVVAQKAKTSHLAYLIVVRVIPLSLLDLERIRLRQYLESDDYDKNRIGIYAYDSLRDPDLKEPAERLLSRLALEYPAHDDPDHLIKIGTRASLQVPV